jgi:amino acid transporter
VDFLVQSLGSIVAFNAMVSIATVSTYIAYVLPTFFRITVGGEAFTLGPFHMGKRLTLVVGWISVLFVIALTVLFCLPTVYPITSQTLNYTPVALGSILVLVLTYWVLSARKWFKGPVRTLEKAESGTYPI